MGAPYPPSPMDARADAPDPTENRGIRRLRPSEVPRASSSVPVLAYSVFGPVTAADLAALRADVDPHTAIRLLIDIERVSRVTAGALTSGLFRLERDVLSRLDRYAVIGPDWLRGPLGLASLVTGKSMQHFYDAPGAMRWLTSDEEPEEATKPTAPGVSVTASPRSDLVVLVASGPMSGGNRIRVDAAIERALHDHDSVDLLVHVSSEQLQVGTADDIRRTTPYGSSIRRIALVGGPEWLAEMVALSSNLQGAEVRRFDTQSETDALAWLGSYGPIAQPPAAS